MPQEELEAQVHMVYKNARATSAMVKKIQKDTVKDLCLMTIARYVTEGWPTRRDQIPADAKPYWLYKEELSMINGIELLIIPPSMRKVLLKQYNNHIWEYKDLTGTNDAKWYTTLSISNSGNRFILLEWTNLCMVEDYYSRYWEIEKLYKTDAATTIRMSFQEQEYKKSLEVTMVHSIIQENLRSLQKIGGFQHITKALARKAKKKYKCCIKLGDKIQLGVWMYCDPLLQSLLLSF